MRKLPAGLSAYWDAQRHAGRDGISLRLRLVFFLLLFLLVVMLGVLIILFSTGIFQAGSTEHKVLLENELTHLSEGVYREYGNISVQGVALADGLSSSLERRMREQGIAPGQLQEKPEILEKLLDESVAALTAALETSRSSGVFLVLDATVNPSLPGADSSRAALYLKNMEPNIVSRTAANLRFMIGPMSVARENGIYVLPQWSMEMDTGYAGWFDKVLATARERELPVSRLYYWTPKIDVPEGGEKVMLCVVPLVAQDGTVFGACGFEVSEMLFKLSNLPTGGNYDYIFCMLTPVEEDHLLVGKALLAGNYASYPLDVNEQPMTVSAGGGNFESYRQEGGNVYAGLKKEVALYPVDSAYAQEKWALALLMPEQILLEELFSHTRVLLMGLAVLLILSILLAVLLSRRYIRPVVKALG
ncbi:MAG: hypothetical protein PHD67_02595 [Oscillospiraceae bacterium]|nr:hypothetical protein [Oscillospiraceae bacterium]